MDETGTVRDSLAVTTPTFTTDLSTLDGVTLAVSTAPGSRIEVIPPQGKSVSVLFSFSFATGGPVGAVLFPAAPTIFAGLIGPAPSMVFGQTQVRQNGNQFTLDAFYSVSAPFSFTGWSAAIEGPFGTSPGSRTYSASSAFVGFYYSDSVDGGQFSNVVPDGAAVPEPGVAVLLGVGLIGGGAIVRRRPASLRG